MTIFQYQARRAEIENRFGGLIARAGSLSDRAQLRATKARELAALDREFGH